MSSEQRIQHKRMITQITHLPTDPLALYLHPYLNDKEWKSFLFTTKLWQSLYYYTLNRRYSIQFYEQEPFRQYLFTKLTNPRTSLSLNLSFVSFPVQLFPFLQQLYALNLSRCRLDSIETLSSLQITKLTLSRCPQIIELPQFPYARVLNLTGCLQLQKIDYNMSHLQSIQLNGCTKLVDISNLKDIPDVELSGCSQLKDVNCLAGAKRLILNDCPKITDVSALGNVKILHLAGCSQLSDVSNLTNNYELNLSRCPLIRSVSNCLKAQKMNLSESDHHSLDLQYLTRVKELNLSHRSGLKDDHLQVFRCHLEQITSMNPQQTPEQQLQQLPSVKLIPNYELISISFSNCLEITSISQFAAVKSLNITNCTRINKLPAINYWKTLNMSYCIHITDFSMLTHLQELHCINCTQITDRDLLQFVNIKILNLQGCVNISDVSPLSKVYDLNISRCTSITDVSSLGDVHTLNLSECVQITNIHGLHSNVSLNLAYCKNIEDITPLQRSSLYEVSLAYCTQIMDVSCLKNVKVLYLHGNPQIQDISMLSNVQIFR